MSAPVVRVGASEPRRAVIAAFPTALAWSASGRQLAVAGDHGEVELLDATAGAPCARWQAHAGPVQSIAWHPQRDTLLTAGQDGAVRLWDAPYSAGDELVEPRAVWADHACWSASGTLAAVAAGGRARVMSPGGTIALGDPLPATITGLAFVPGGKALACASYGGVQLIDVANGRTVRTLAAPGSMLSIAVSPDAAVIACGTQDKTVRVWRLAADRDAELAGYPAKPERLAFSHDSRWLATSGDTAVRLWPCDRQGPDGRRAVHLEGHQAMVTALGYAPGVALLLTGDRDGIVALWAPPGRTTPLLRGKLGAPVVHVAWGADAATGALRWAAADERGGLLLGQL